MTYFLSLLFKFWDKSTKIWSYLEHFTPWNLLLLTFIWPLQNSIVVFSIIFIFPILIIQYFFFNFMSSLKGEKKKNSHYRSFVTSLYKPVILFLMVWSVLGSCFSPIYVEILLSFYFLYILWYHLPCLSQRVDRWVTYFGSKKYISIIHHKRKGIKTWPWTLSLLPLIAITDEGAFTSYIKMSFY